MQKHNHANPGSKCKGKSASKAREAKQLQDWSAVRPGSLFNYTRAHKHNAWKKVWQTIGEVGWKVVPLWNVFNAFMCFWYFHHFGVLQPHLPLLAAATAPCQHWEAARWSRVGLSHHCARRCRKSFCSFVFQAAINAQYFHTSEKLATSPPRHQGKGSHTYSCWACTPRFKKDMGWDWHNCSVNLTFFRERFSDMTIYNWHHRDKIKNTARLLFFFFFLSFFALVCHLTLTFSVRKHSSVTKVVFYWQISLYLWTQEL